VHILLLVLLEGLIFVFVLFDIVELVCFPAFFAPRSLKQQVQLLHVLTVSTISTNR
jgi:hypothetical protein